MPRYRECRSRPALFAVQSGRGMKLPITQIVIVLGAATLTIQSASSQGMVRISATCSAETVQALSLPCSGDHPCPLYLEVAAAEQVGPRMVVTGNIHTGSMTLESVLLTSDDDGRTWSEPHGRLRSAVLDQIQFIDFEAGWINGHVLTNVPRDAFLLLTTDGGRTWRRRPVFGESRTGVVEQFWFDSRNHGTLTIDRVRAAENGFRYELWETLTGGESWSVKQVDSRPVPFRKPPREPLLRFRADADKDVHRLERRSNSAWTEVATFAISAGECKPAEAAGPPEPPPPALPADDPI